MFEYKAFLKNQIVYIIEKKQYATLGHLKTILGKIRHYEVFYRYDKPIIEIIPIPKKKLLKNLKSKINKKKAL